MEEITNILNNKKCRPLKQFGHELRVIFFAAGRIEMIEQLTKQEDGTYLDKEGCTWEDRKSFLQIEMMGFCGCGDPDDIMLYVKEMLETLDKQEWKNYEDKPYMFFVYWANDKNFAEHGTTARCSWLTDKGKELLNDINICIADEPAAK